MRKKKSIKITKTFKAAKGARFSNKDAKQYGEYLEKLASEGGDEALTPINIVNKAHAKNNPLHDYFEWDDTEAAKAHRLWQARHLANHIEVVIIFPDGEESTVKKFHSIITTPETKGRSYITLERVISIKEYKRQMVAQALDEVNSWKERYRQYAALSGIFVAIEKTEAKINGRKALKAATG